MKVRSRSLFAAVGVVLVLMTAGPVSADTDEHDLGDVVLNVIVNHDCSLWDEGHFWSVEVRDEGYNWLHSFSGAAVFGGICDDDTQGPRGVSSKVYENRLLDFASEPDARYLEISYSCRKYENGPAKTCELSLIHI